MPKKLLGGSTLVSLEPVPFTRPDFSSLNTEPGRKGEESHQYPLSKGGKKVKGKGT